VNIAVVGNGASARNYAPEIDGADFVVRMTEGHIAHRFCSGSRVDAYAWYGHELHAMMPLRFMAEAREFWHTVPSERPHGRPEVARDRIKTVLRHLGGRTLRVISQAEYDALTAELAEQYMDAKSPSTGLVTLHMALARAPDRVDLYGYDATTRGQPGWGNEAIGWPDKDPHPFLAEKRMIRDLVQTGKWLRKPAPPVAWHAMPEVPE